MATIQIRRVPSDVHRTLRVRAAAAGQSLQQYMLEMVCRQAQWASAEELLARKRAQIVAHGEAHLDPSVIVEVIRADRESMPERLTVQAAAGLLGVSRTTLVKLLDDGEIPDEQVGRHRRVLRDDVLAYREKQSARAREALDQMVEIADESGMYELTAEPKRTR